MNPRAQPELASRDLLARAFEGFERAAANLEQGHSVLRREVTRLERELLDAHRRLEAVLDALDTGVAVLSGNGVLRANRAFEGMGVGCDREGLTDVLALARGGTARIRQSTPDGERDLALNVRPVGDNGGTPPLPGAPGETWAWVGAARAAAVRSGTIRMRIVAWVGGVEGGWEATATPLKVAHPGRGSRPARQRGSLGGLQRRPHDRRGRSILRPPAPASPTRTIP